MRRDKLMDLALSHVNEIASYARRLTGSRWDADDLVQATYERAFRKWSELRDPARVRPWLFRICRHLHLDRVRAVAARPELRVVGPTDRLAPEPTLSPEAVERTTVEQLERALQQLPSEQREAVLLCDLWGFRYEEIADIVDVAVGTVRSRIARGRQALAAALQAQDDPQPAHRSPAGSRGGGGGQP